MKAKPDVALPGNCSIRDSAALKAQLAAALEVDAPVTVNTGAVERIDTASVQLLFAFVRDRAAASRAVEWRGTSKAFSQALAVLGFDASHGFPASQG